MKFLLLNMVEIKINIYVKFYEIHLMVESSTRQTFHIGEFGVTKLTY